MYSFGLPVMAPISKVHREIQQELTNKIAGFKGNLVNSDLTNYTKGEYLSRSITVPVDLQDVSTEVLIRSLAALVLNDIKAKLPKGYTKKTLSVAYKLSEVEAYIVKEGENETLKISYTLRFKCV